MNRFLTAISAACLIIGIIGIVYGLTEERKILSEVEYYKSQYEHLTQAEIRLAELGKLKTEPIDVNGDGKIDWKDFDVNNDGYVGADDIVKVAKAYNTTLGEKGYNPRCDFNGDNIVGGIDLQLIASYFGYPRMSLLFDIETTAGRFFITGLAFIMLGITVFVYQFTKGR